MTNKQKALTRLAVLALALANLALEALGKSVLPFDDKQLTEFISQVFVFIASVSSWWFNNNITPEAEEAQAYLEALKEGKNLDVHAPSVSTEKQDFDDAVG